MEEEEESPSVWKAVGLCTVSSLLLLSMLKLSLSFFSLIPQIIVMYLQVLECERNQTLVQTAW